MESPDQGPPTTEFAVLGPLEVIGPCGRIEITGAKERAVLAVLVAWGGTVVSTERLTDALWGDQPPRSSVKVIRNLVSKLRKALGTDAIDTRPGGYVLRAGPDAIDVERFDRLAAEGRRHAADRDWGAAALAYSTAADLWRGTPLGEVPEWQPACAEAARLAELHRGVREEEAAADLANGRHRELVASLEAMVTEEPLRERRWALLMVALHRCGRQAEAMRAFQRARGTLAELGLEPGPELAELERELTAGVDTSPVAVRRAGGFTVPCPSAISAEPTFAFAGRDVEDEELRRAWARADAGERRTVLVGGESGVGKTRLAFEQARRSAAAGAAVLLGTCDTELAMPYQPWVHVLDHLVRAMPAEVTAALSGELVEVSPLLPHLHRTLRIERTPSSDPGTEQHRLFSAVDAILADAASRWPTVVVIDDLQWASRQSLALLRHLSRSGAASRLLLIGTFRDTGDEITEPLASFLAELRRSETTSRLRLAGLDQESVERFVAGALGHELDDDLRVLASSVAEHSGGNAFYVNELWRHIVASRVVERRGDRWFVRRSAEVGVPDGVREVVAHRVHKLSGSAQEVLEVAAIAGQQVDLRVLGVAVDGPDDTVGLGMDELVEAKLLLEIGGVLPLYLFAHAIVRDTVAGAILPHARARLHHRVAEAIESVFGADPRPVLAQLAGHYAAAAAVGGSTKAISYGRRAAAQAMDLVAYDEAVRHLRVALELSPAGSEERVGVLLDIGAANSRQGLAREAMAAFADGFRDARELGLVSEAVRAAIGFEEAVQIPGLPGDPAVAIVSEALEMLGAEDSPLRARLQACLANALAMAGRLHEAWEMSELAIADARRHGDREVLLSALKAGLTYSDDATRWLRAAREMSSLAVQLDDRWASALAQSAEIRGLFMHGRIEEAREAAATFRLAVERSRFVFYRYMGMHFEVMLGLVDGRFDDAERSAGEAQDFGSSSQSESDAGVYGVQMYFIRREQGRLAEVEPVLRLAAALEPDAPVWRPGLAALYADTGMLEDARREFERLATDGFASLPQDAMRPCSLALLAEVCVALGDGERADLLYRELEPFRGFTLMVSYTICLGPAERLLGNLAALTGGRDARAHFVAALELAERSGSPVWRAHVQHDWAAALGDRPDLLAAAGATARQLGMGALAERCRLATTGSAPLDLAGPVSPVARGTGQLTSGR